VNLQNARCNNKDSLHFSFKLSGYQGFHVNPNCFIRYIIRVWFQAMLTFMVTAKYKPTCAQRQKWAPPNEPSAVTRQKFFNLKNCR